MKSKFGEVVKIIISVLSSPMQLKWHLLCEFVNGVTFV